MSVEQCEENGSALFESMMRFRRGYKQQINFKGTRMSETAVMHMLIHGCRHNGGEMNPSRISAVMGIRQPTLSPILRKLEDEGLISRRHDEKDRRMTYLCPTEKALALHKEHVRRCNRVFRGLEEHLGPDDCRKLIELMTRAAHYFLSLPEEGGEGGVGE
jgi:DNA-binding MarR family transcriptional regulator